MAYFSTYYETKRTKMEVYSWKIIFKLDVEVSYEDASYTFTEDQDSAEVCVISSFRGIAASFTVNITTNNTISINSEFHNLSLYIHNYFSCICLQIHPHFSNGVQTALIFLSTILICFRESATIFLLILVWTIMSVSFLTATKLSLE